MKNIFKNKSFKYGSASVVLTAVILALIVVINVVFVLLADNYHWFVDMTEEKLYTVSDTSKMLLDEVMRPDEEGKTLYEGKLSIIFLQDRDKILSAATKDGQQLRQVHELALDYQDEYADKIEILYIDMYARPGALAQYRAKGAVLSPTSVIFDNNDGIFQVVSVPNFFAYSSGELVGFYGEHRITSTILSLCNKRYIAYVTEGHGEDQLPSSFAMLLESCGYTLKSVNLQNMDEFEKTVREDEPRLVIVYNPKYEFVKIGENSRSEVTKLFEILSGRHTNPDNPSFASLLLFADPEKGCANKNLNSLLNSWGLNICATEEYTVRETAGNAIETNLVSFFAGYASDALTSSLSRVLASAENFKVAVDGAGVIEVRDLGSSDLSISNGAVLRASRGAENDAGNASNAALLALSLHENTVAQSIKKYNYVIACSDASIVSDEYLNSASFANEALFINILRATTKETDRTPKSVLIEYKDYIEETNVEDVSVGGKQAFLIVMAAVLPVAMLACGIFVYVRRRNKV